VFFCLALAGCFHQDDDDVEQQADEGYEEVGEAGSALVSDYYIPDDGASAPPLAISWVTTIGSTAALSTVSYRVKNTGSTSRTFTLDQRAFGLDDRSLTRRIGDYTLSGGQEMQGAVTLSTIPVKSVSHSTQLAIQATLTHNGEPLTLIGPPAFTHYNSCGDGNPGNVNIPVTDSCAGPFFTNIGPEVVPGSQLPGDMVWKNVIAHELGHDVQRKLNGVPHRTYEFKNGVPCSDPNELDSLCQPDDTSIGSACRCDHVVSANRLHCLQSRETMTAGNAEGFAHFMGARIWNISTQSDCTYNYYKEFMEPGGVVKQPPYKVNCKAATKWRDNYCFSGSRGTEYDWLQFFWNLNTVSANKLPLGDIGAIHLGSCGGNCETLNMGVDWLSLRTAAENHYGGALQPKALYFTNTGDAFGVDETP